MKVTSPLNLALRVPTELREAAERAAGQKSLSMASLVKLALTEWLREKGFMK